MPTDPNGSDRITSKKESPWRAPISRYDRTLCCRKRSIRDESSSGCWDGLRPERVLSKFCKVDPRKPRKCRLLAGVEDLDPLVGQNIGQCVKEEPPLSDVGVLVHPLRVPPEPVVPRAVVGIVQPEKNDLFGTQFGGEMHSLIAGV